MSNNILKYTSKDYESIKQDLIDSISSLTNVWTSREDGDPGIVLVKLMSALGDMLSFNADAQALEYYAPTVTQRKNASKVFNLVGYKMHWYRSATTQLTLTNNAPMDQYMLPCKQYYDYTNNLTSSQLDILDPVPIQQMCINYYDIANSSNGLSISFTPDGYSLLPGQSTRHTFTYSILPSTDTDKWQTNGIDENGTNMTALEFFTMYASSTYKLWQNDNVVPLSRYIENKNRTLGIYSSGSQDGIVYSLIPSTETPSIDSSTGEYNPDIELLPYTPITVQAVQGYLCTVTFTSKQLKDNRFYVPDSMLDENYMYLSYITTDSSNNESVVFLKKSDNLLTITDFKDEVTQKTIVYFEFGVDEFDFPYIELASYWRSVITEDTITFKFSYIRTEGKYGNITNNYLNSIDTNSSIDVSVLNLANSDYEINSDGEVICSPGFNPETASEAYINSLNYIMTYNTLVTIYDFTRFLKREPDISNGFACDGQHADDLNKEIFNTCSSYTKDQLLSILGSDDTLINKSQYELANYLYQLRKINYNYNQSFITRSEVYNDSQNQDDFLVYSINLYPIVGKFKTIDQNTGSDIAYMKNIIRTSVVTPYYLYGINTEDIVGSANQDRFKIETMINSDIRDTQIVTVQPKYTACRVFKWRCCGTLHLTQSVTNIEAQNILKSVINNLSETYAPINMQFGKKLTYMEIIDTVLQSDERIRYFDAGIGDKKLVDFDIPTGVGSDYFNIEAYFNPESIMQYVQTYEEITDSSSNYYNMITIDPSYLQSSV